MTKQRTSPIHLAASILGYLFYFLGHLVFAVFLVPLFVLIFPLPGNVRRAFRDWIFDTYVTFLSQVYLPSLGIYRIAEISGLERAREAGPAVYVANHRSRMDGPMLLSIIKSAATLIKTTYASNPLYAGFVKFLNFIPVDQYSINGLSAALDKSQQLVRAGINILVFPEGSRAPSGRGLPFKDIAFRIAMATNAAVVPVVVHSSVPFMAKRPGSIWPKRLFTFTVRFLEPCRAREGERPGEFADRVRMMIMKELKELDRGTAWEV